MHNSQTFNPIVKLEQKALFIGDRRKSMNAKQQDLYQKIQAYQFDRPDDPKPFSTKLAKENGWSLGYTQRAIEEYRKFTFLAMVAPHIVSPSEQVDRVWHMHLTYSRTYWEDFCPHVLGRPLHHEPSRGGQAELQKYENLYLETLQSYSKFFGPPPTDLWPSAQKRFGHDTHSVTINTQDVWIVPKPNWQLLQSNIQRLLTRSILPTTLFATTFIVAGCQVQQYSPNPFDLDGPGFLIFYAVSWIAILFISIIWRGLQRLPRANNRNLEPNLDVYEMADLAGGVERLVDTALAQLYQQEYIEIENGNIVATPKANTLQHPIEQTVLQAIAASPNTKLSSIRQQVSNLSWLTENKQNLQQKLLLMSAEQITRSKFGPMMLFLVLLVVGIIRIFNGMAQSHPVGYLMVFCSITLIAVFICFATQRLTYYGKAVLKHTRNSFATTRLYAEHPMAAYQVATMGISAASTWLPMELMVFAKPPTSSGSSSSDGGGCGGGGCGGGGCGGGGCGGGGCGG
jgi:uncharacterized protein (TIGR04222 family)